MLPRQLNCASLPQQRPIDRAIELPAAQGETDVLRVSDRHDTVRCCTRCHGGVVQRGLAAAFRSGLIGRLRSAPFTASRLLVHPQQQPDQGFPLRLSSGRTAAAVRVRVRPRSPGRGSYIPSRSARSNGCGRPRAGPDVDQPALLQHGQRPADRPLVEADDVTDARRRNAGSIASSDMIRHSVTLTPKSLLIDHGRAARQLVGDEGDERRNIAVEVEHLFGASAPACRARAGGARLSVPGSCSSESSLPALQT